MVLSPAKVPTPDSEEARQRSITLGATPPAPSPSLVASSSADGRAAAPEEGDRGAGMRHARRHRARGVERARPGSEGVRRATNHGHHICEVVVPVSSTELCGFASFPRARALPRRRRSAATSPPTPRAPASPTSSSSLPRPGRSAGGSCKSCARGLRGSRTGRCTIRDLRTSSQRSAGVARVTFLCGAGRRCPPLLPHGQRDNAAVLQAVSMRVPPRRLIALLFSPLFPVRVSAGRIQRRRLSTVTMACCRTGAAPSSSTQASTLRLRAPLLLTFFCWSRRASAASGRPAAARRQECPAPVVARLSTRIASFDLTNSFSQMKS